MLLFTLTSHRFSDQTIGWYTWNFYFIHRLTLILVHCYDQPTLKKVHKILYCKIILEQSLYFTGNNYALSATASQSNTHSTWTASAAVDGDLNTYSGATNSFNVGDYWWKVDIGQRIIFTNASIYVRDGRCSTPSFDCCKYFSLFLQYSSLYSKC